MEGVLNGSPDDEWRMSVSVFAEHWAERGLRLSERTVGAIERMLSEDLEIRDVFDGVGALGQEETIFLAAAPRRRESRKAPRQHASASSPAIEPEMAKRLPRGKWIAGTEGNGVVELEKRIQIDANRKVTRIEFQNGLPILDNWALPGEEIVIAITGDNDFDQTQAREAWFHSRGERLPEGYVFHHDGGAFQIVDYEGEKVFVGRMQAVPAKLNVDLPHVGTAHVARKVPLKKELARKVNQMAMKGAEPLGKLRRNLAKAIARRTAKFARMIPILGGLITLYSFAEDAEAHGLGGAVIRATPLLGDVVAAYDVGSELAAMIVSAAEEKADAAIREANAGVKAAQAAACKAAIEAYSDIAKNLRITSPYIESTDDVVDVVKEGLAEFYGEMYPVFARKYQASDGHKPSDAEIQTRVNNAKNKLRSHLQNNLQQSEPPRHKQLT